MGDIEVSEKELQDLADGLVGRTLQKIDSETARIHKELNDRFEAEFSPDNPKVLDLEKKLEEYDHEFADLKKSASEEVRLLKAEFTALGHGFTRAEGGPIDPMRVDYQGKIMPADVMRALVQTYSADGEFIARAATGDFAATSAALDALSGKLPPDVADRFIDLVVAETALLSNITTRRMLSPEAKLDEISIGKRALRTPTEGADTGHGDPVLSFPARTLTTVEMSFAEDITLSFLEDNIERNNAEATIAAVLARAFGSDLNDLGVNGVGAGVGGTPAGDAAFLNLKEGFMNIVNGLTYDGAAGNPEAGQQVTLTGITSAKTALSTLHAGIPQRYKSRTDYIYWVPTRLAEAYADETAGRETGLGDQVLINGFPALRFFGRPVIAEPHLQDQDALLTGALDTGDMVLLAPRELLVWGVHRAIRSDAEYRPRKRAVEYTITARAGFQIASVVAHVQGTTLDAI